MREIIIANPIYDTAFKFLMEDKSIAKAFLSLILNEKIIYLEVEAQEVIIPTTDGMIRVLRLDYHATIETEDGAKKNILIELQKTKLLHNIQRFRNYVGRNYIDSEPSKKGVNINPALEIITIYIVGFPLEHIDVPVLHVKRQLLDAITGEVLKKSSNFVKLLTHESFVIQLPYLSDSFRNDLEKVLDIFNQKYVIKMEGQKPLLLNFTEGAKHPLVQKMAKRLEMAASDSAVRKQLEDEAEVEAMLTQNMKSLEQERDEERAQKRKVQRALARAEQEKEEVKAAYQKLLEENGKLNARVEELNVRLQEISMAYQKLLAENVKLNEGQAEMMKLLQQLLDRK